MKTHANPAAQWAGGYGAWPPPKVRPLAEMLRFLSPGQGAWRRTPGWDVPPDAAHMLGMAELGRLDQGRKLPPAKQAAKPGSA